MGCTPECDSPVMRHLGSRDRVPMQMTGLYRVCIAPTSCVIELKRSPRTGLRAR